jgi:hypothetical protein
LEDAINREAADPIKIKDEGSKNVNNAFKEFQFKSAFDDIACGDNILCRHLSF